MTFRWIAPLAAIGLGVAACSAGDGYYAPRSQAAYAPAQTTYYAAPGGSTVVATPATSAYATDAPNFQKSNVYSSRADYYRNYQGIHGGPERTGW